MKKLVFLKEFQNFNPHPEKDFPQLDYNLRNNDELDREEMEEPLEVVSGFEDDEVEKMSDEELEDMYSALEKDIKKRNEGFIKKFESFREPSNREEMIETLYNTSNFEKEELEEMTDEELEDLYNSLETKDWLDELDNEDSDSFDEFDSLDEAKKSGVTASLKKKSKASGIPMGILRKVFSKGMQAWNAGHRPGVAQHQWGMGRVNSFITGAGGARKADADLWAKAKAAKARKKKRK
jgi:hypothetical protein